jgi:hypothetical protein
MLDLEPIKARMEAATEGPWHKLFSTASGPSVGIYKDQNQRHQQTLAYGLSDNNQDFVAHSRTDIPALVAEVEMLREALGEAVDILGNDLMDRIGGAAKAMEKFGFDFDLPETEL